MHPAAQITDPDGRVVELTVERWEHITVADGHPELAGSTTRSCAPLPSRTCGVRAGEPNEEWFFLAGIGPSRWLQVVVAYAEGRGWIVTAFARRTDP